MSRTALALNSGSSTLKFGAYSWHAGAEHELSTGTLDARSVGPAQLVKQALEQLSQAGVTDISLVGHRIVHGGENLIEPVRVDDEVFAQLGRLVPLAPLHLPPALEVLREARRALPGAVHVACFDTAFHASLPEVARRFALSEELYRSGLRRYGFHGLSYQYVLSALGAPLPRRLIVAHLGSGASLAAVLDGRCIDTTMGFTPAGGVPMGSRSGDLDPGALIYLLRDRGYSVEQLEELVNHGSGLAGTAGSGSAAELLERAGQGDPSARAALELFAYAVKKQIGAYMAALGGLDCLVFTGGIGENAAPIRARVLRGLESLGLILDDELNAAGAAVVSAPDSRCQVRIVRTKEDLMIVRAAWALVRS